MFGKEYSEGRAMALKREQKRVLKDNAVKRREAGLTLHEQRKQEGRLAAEEHTQAETGSLAVQQAAVETVPVKAEPPADPEAFAGNARLGFAVAAVLVLFLLWLKVRK